MRMPCTGRLLALLLLTAALLGFAARAASHEHAAPVPGADPLCAICVYGGGSLAGAPAPQVQPPDPCPSLRPAAPVPGLFSATLPRHTRIRGPPSPA